MQPNDKPQFLAALNELAALKPGAKLTVEAYAGWWNALREHWTIDEFRSACAQLARTCEFMPNPYHFEQLRKAGRLTAGEAWAAVREIARTRGTPHEDPRVNAAVHALGGYFAIGMTNTDQMPFLERRFAEHYESISDAEDTREAVPQIAGPPRARLNGPQPITQLLGRNP